MTNKRRLAYLAMIINVLIWGAALPIVKPSYAFITPFQFLYFRYLIAALLMFPLLIFLLFKHKPTLKQLLTIIALEILAVPIPLSFLYYGLSLTSSIEASLLSATSPLLVTLGAIFFLKEKEERREWLGLTLALSGTILLALEPFLTSSPSTSFSLTGNFMILAHNLIWATYLLIAKRYYRKLPKTLIASISMTTALISFFLINLATSSLPSLSLLSTPTVLRAVLYMGILGSPIAFTLYIFGQDRIEASEASLFSYLTGPIAIPVAIFLLHESVRPAQLLATLIIFIGVFLGEIRPKSRQI